MIGTTLGHEAHVFCREPEPERIPHLSRAVAWDSVGVLPFANLSADPEQEFFCDGMAEEIINALAQVQGLRVVSRRCAGEALTTKDPWVIPHRIMCPAIVPADPLVDDPLVSALP